jgi:hypothetical protein
MNWKDYVGNTDLISTTIPTLPGRIYKKHKKCHNGRYRCKDSNHAPPDYKSEPTCSANPSKRRPITTTTHRKSQCGSHKNEKDLRKYFHSVIRSGALHDAGHVKSDDTAPSIFTAYEHSIHWKIPSVLPGFHQPHRICSWNYWQHGP